MKKSVAVVLLVFLALIGVTSPLFSQSSKTSTRARPLQELSKALANGISESSTCSGHF